MPDPAQTGGSPKTRSKPNTRSSSLRQSLTLASVGKAIIAGVRSKDPSTDDVKAAKKAKDSRRASVTPVAPPRASIGGESRPLVQPSKRDSVTPDAKIVTRRRAAAGAQQPRSRTDSETMRTPDANATPTGANPRGGSSLRPPKNATSSALPKLRSRAIGNAEQGKPPSPAPVKAGARRRSSTSSSDEGGKEQRKPESSPMAVADKNTRPISPLPHRAALKSSSAVNATPPATPSASSKMKPPSPTVYRNGSPTRPTKLMKTTTTSAQKNLPRPPSSSSGSATPLTPKGPSALRTALTRSTQDRSKTGSTPIRDSPLTPSRDSPSPLARRSRKGLKSASTSSSSFSSSNVTDTASRILEGNSDSDEEDDVQALLAPTNNLALATPAMPRINRVRRRGLEPANSSRPREQQPRLSLSHLLPPSNKSGKNTSTLRPPKASPATQASKDPLRMSILSWEHASLTASQQLGQGEVDKMLYDVAAPFSGPTSPTISHIEIPPSPCLSAIDSPLGFGSISQVLLPEVTPSPAVHLNASARYNISHEASADSAATYLRLQLAAAEELSNERMHRMMAMEEEIHNLKQAHQHQMEEMTAQMAFVEQQNQSAHVAALEEQVRAARAKGLQAMREVATKKEEEAKAQKARALKAQRRKMDAVYSSVLAGTAWIGVQEACQAELETVQEERQVLSMLLAELERMTLSL